MTVYRAIAALSAIPGPLFLAIGVFDGVHLGHQAVIARACEDAKEESGTPVVVTFDPHPMRVLRPDRAPRLLTATPHKLELLAELGVKHVLLASFTEEFAHTAPEHFIEQLAAAGRPLREICVGETWSFGKDRAGNLELLSRLGEVLGFAAIGLPVVQHGSEIVSSTAVRQAVERGDLAAAESMLGRPYTILGTVEKGDQVGRTIGFPTANISAHSEQFPPNGVYAVCVRHAGQTFGGVANIGLRPTVKTGSSSRVFEVHLLDFGGDLYGCDLQITFHSFLRGEQRFAGLDELKGQIARDSAEARLRLG